MDAALFRSGVMKNARYFAAQVGGRMYRGRRSNIIERRLIKSQTSSFACRANEAALKRAYAPAMVLRVEESQRHTFIRDSRQRVVADRFMAQKKEKEKKEEERKNVG